MALVGGWFDWAIPLPLDYNRTLAQGGKAISTTPNRMEIVVNHSLEGGVFLTSAMREMANRWESLGSRDRSAVIAALDRAYWAWREPTRPTTGWHWTTLRGCPSGVVVQHAPITARLAHGHSANPLGPGGEAEGTKGNLLDAGQIRANIRIHDDLEAAGYLPYRRENGRLAEHGEYGPTSCPSGRYAPLYVAMRQHDQGIDVRDAIERLERRIDDLSIAVFAGSERGGASRAERLHYANWRIEAANAAQRQSVATEAGSAQANVDALAGRVSLVEMAATAERVALDARIAALERLDGASPEQRAALLGALADAIEGAANDLRALVA